MRIRNCLVITTLIGGFLAVPGGVALASPSDNFGSHVRACAQTMGLSGSHNPGMHQGAAGWDGLPCHSPH